MQILLVEDDQPTSAVLTASLRAQHYQVSTVIDGQAGLDLARQLDYDLIILDVELPKLDGICLCQALRDYGNATPVLLLTARESATDRILGLDAGADDYVIKPFDLAELLARVRALLRRGKGLITPQVTWENLCLDSACREVRADGIVLHLTPKEYGLLELFLSTPNRVFSRSAILDRLWNPAESPGEETVSTHIKCLRQKLEAAGVANPIKTVHGMGYRLRPAESSSKQLIAQTNPQKSQQVGAQQAPAPAGDSPTQTAVLAEPPIADQPADQLPANPLPEATASKSIDPEQAAQALAITRRVWQQSADQMLAQVEQIEQAVELLLGDGCTAELRQQAAQTAHKLAGSLGIFGLHAGSSWAKQIEDWLQPQILLDDLQKAQLQGWVQALSASLPKFFSPASPLARQTSPIPQTPDQPLILAILTDGDLAEQLTGLALRAGLRFETATARTAQARLVQMRPDVILLDLDWRLPNQGRALLDHLAQSSTPQPLIALSAQETLQNRLAVAEVGGVFLQRPASVFDLFHAIMHVLGTRQPAPSRVMVVDDDPAILTWLSSRLQPLEIQVTGLSDPQQFWQQLAQLSDQDSPADLLILDLEMPVLTGWQLTQMVRSDLQWQHLPILMLSNHGSPDQIDRAFQAGADDYFHKSSLSQSDGNALIERILRRLKRAGQSFGQGAASSSAASSSALKSQRQQQQKQQQDICG
ncbi:MAG: response regulator [Pegethrix bostrychoides GSE-TBD4-15B]|jgi:DNA-binding response OmpR family regulator|uniref:Response regulator n=1 Tax=Pegethrix bostrychoides GSE-TBD4-15B TaxID=2839662 RepID=A0A951U579_9CYAN|nr:response regulator [Pegethrix bostrychoides GSE-TBD4-15B]